MRVHSARFVWLVVGPVALSHGTCTSGHHMGSLEAGNVEFYSNSVELNCSCQDLLNLIRRMPESSYAWHQHLYFGHK